MLVLARTLDETIVIGDPAKPIAVVKVVRIRGDSIRIGVECPKNIPVHRGEVAKVLAAEGRKMLREQR